MFLEINFCYMPCLALGYCGLYGSSSYYLWACSSLQLSWAIVQHKQKAMHKIKRSRWDNASILIILLSYTLATLSVVQLTGGIFVLATSGIRETYCVAELGLVITAVWDNPPSPQDQGCLALGLMK